MLALTPRGQFRDAEKKPEYPGRNPRVCGENMQTPDRKAPPGRDSDQEPSCCEATVLTTVQPYMLTLILKSMVRSVSPQSVE